MNPTRIVPVVIAALLLVSAAFAPDAWLSESVWLIYLVGCVAWEFVGVYFEKRYNQEPLTHIYADRLMNLDKVGWIFRIAWLALFAWWIVHWVQRTTW